jgi:hypothetical protein
MPDRNDDRVLEESGFSREQRAIADAATRDRRGLDEPTRLKTAPDSDARDLGNANRWSRDDALPQGVIERGGSIERDDALPRGVIDRRSEYRSDEERIQEEVSAVRAGVPALSQRGWEERAYVSERAELLQKVESILAQYQARERQSVQRWPPDRTAYGSFEEYERDLQRHGTGWKGLHDPDEKRIVIHESVLKDESHWGAMRVLAHEARHAFQDALIQEYRKAQIEERETDLCGVSPQTVREWIYAGPIPDPGRDFQGYLNHPREMDARAYERRFIEEFKRGNYDR